MIKPIAIHLPQFHPFAENDEWWGEGFTEWTNVRKAKPLFKGHYQPHVPADLGYYDLRDETTRMAQAELAAQYGIYGFCYYHYWFNGTRLMKEPLDAIVQSGKPDFPFMLCWANENWTRRWDGLDNEILIKQNYSQDDDIAHIRFLINTFFHDKRYIRVDDKPFFLIYRPNLLPDVKGTIELWRREAKAAGMELFVGFTNNFSYQPDDIKSIGFDCVVDFQPNLNNMPVKLQFPFVDRVKNKLRLGQSAHFTNRVFSYGDYVDYMVNDKTPHPDNWYPGIMPGWDNSARKSKDAFIFTKSSPAEYGRWLKHIAEEYKGRDTFLFINAWNEWAEGNHLEPCQKWGRQYLEQTADILRNA